MKPVSGYEDLTASYKDPCDKVKETKQKRWCMANELATNWQRGDFGPRIKYPYPGEP